MKVRAAAAAVVFSVLLIAGIGITMVSGYWRTESSKEPVRYETGNFAGEYNPADIRGSYSLGDIERSFGIPASVLARAYGISSGRDAAQVQVKEIEASFGIIDGFEIGTDSMRLFVALYRGLPYSPAEDTGLPLSAFGILEEKGGSPGEILSGYKDRVVILKEMAFTGNTPIETEAAKIEDAFLITGKTLFSELLSLGISREEISGVLGIPMGAPGGSIRDFCTVNGIEFSTVKEALQILVR